MSEAADKIARSAFAQIFAAHPHLEWRENNANPVEISISLPTQAGLKHDIWLALQNEDELHFSVGHLWLEWFPCTDLLKTQAFVDAVCGFISGECRVVEQYKGADCVKARLQIREGETWQTIGTWSKLRLPSLSVASERTLANV
jgi:hypothetical protein